MLNDVFFYNCTPKQDARIQDAKNIFGENLPYIIEKRMAGNVVIFNDHFISACREAFTTGCLAKMNSMEVDLFERFVKFQNGVNYRDITTSENEVMTALDKWFMDDIHCLSHPVINECFDAATHTWTSCTN